MVFWCCTVPQNHLSTGHAHHARNMESNITYTAAPVAPIRVLLMARCQKALRNSCQSPRRVLQYETSLNHSAAANDSAHDPVIKPWRAPTLAGQPPLHGMSCRAWGLADVITHLQPTRGMQRPVVLDALVADLKLTWSTGPDAHFSENCSQDTPFSKA